MLMNAAFLLRDTGRDKGFTRECIADGTENIDRIFAGSREIPPNPCKGVSPFECPESPRHFLFDLDHTDIPFRLVIIKRDAEVLHER